jgi:hypothetical protein
VGLKMDGVPPGRRVFSCLRGMDYSMASSPSISFVRGAFSSEHYMGRVYIPTDASGKDLCCRAYKSSSCLVFSHCSIFSQRADCSMANLLVEHVFGLHGFKCSKSAVA